MKHLVINEDACNELETDLVLSGFSNLETLVIKKNTFSNLNSFKICNNEKLREIDIEDGEEWQVDDQLYADGSFWYVDTVVIESIVCFHN